MNSHDTPSFGPVPANPTHVDSLESGFDTFGGSAYRSLPSRTTFLQPGPDFLEDLLLREMIEYGNTFGMDIGRLYSEDKPTLLRFLHACNGNIEHCFRRIAEHQAWLSEGLLEYYNLPSVKKDVAMFAIEFIGKDKTQHPVLVVHPTKLAEMDLPRALGVVLFHLNHGIKKLFTPGFAESFTLLVDFSTEESRRCIIPFNMYMELFQIIFNYYPNFLHQVLFVSPVSLAALEKVLQEDFGEVIPPSTYKKIRIFETPDYKNQLTQFIEPNSVGEAYRKLYDPNYNPPTFGSLPIQSSFGNHENAFATPPMETPFTSAPVRSGTPPPPYFLKSFELTRRALLDEPVRYLIPPPSNQSEFEETIPPKPATQTKSFTLPTERMPPSSSTVAQAPSSHSSQAPSSPAPSSGAPSSGAPSNAPVEILPEYETQTNEKVSFNTERSSPLAPDLEKAINPLLPAFQSTDPHRKFLNLVSYPRIPGEAFTHTPPEPVFSHRHIFGEPFLPTEEAQLSAYNDFVKRNSYSNTDFMADKSHRLRFLQANEFDHKKAYEALKASFMWRQSQLPKASDTLKEHLKLGLAYVFGRDRDMRPILIVDAGVCATKNEKIVTSVIFFWIEYMIQTCMVPGKVDQIRVIGDLSGGSGGSFKTSFAKELLDNYPCRLHKIYLINAGIFQRTSLNWRASDLPAQTRAKITILNADYFGVLHGEISSCQIQAKYGGREPDPTDFLKPHFPKIRYRRDIFNSTTSNKEKEPQFQQIPRWS